MENFLKLQREKSKKPVKLNQQAVEECQKILKGFFEAMTAWEHYVSEKGFEDTAVKPHLLVIWEQYISEKPRQGYRPLGLSYSSMGTYSEEHLLMQNSSRGTNFIFIRKQGVLDLSVVF